MTDLLRPCVKCGAINRDVSGSCKPCGVISNAIWRANNKEKIRANGIAYRANNPEKVKALRKASYRANPEKAKADAAAWVAANPERVKLREAAWIKLNPEKRRKARDTWKMLNPGKTSAAIERWRKANLDVCNLAGQNYRAKKRENGGILSKGLAVKLFKLQKAKCACCRKLLGDDYHLDHIMPLAREGPNTDENIQLLCPNCNCSKGAKHPTDFMQSRGFLL